MNIEQLKQKVMELDAQVLQNECDVLMFQSLMSRGVVVKHKNSLKKKTQYRVGDKVFHEPEKAQTYLNSLNETIEKLNDKSVDCIREMMKINKEVINRI